MNTTIEKIEGQRFKSFPRNIFFKLKDYTKDKYLNNAKACNYRNSKGNWIIIVYLQRIHKLSKYKRIAERINNLYLQEYLCTIMRKNTDGKLPPCETKELSKEYVCNCLFPLDHGMRLKIKR